MGLQVPAAYACAPRGENATFAQLLDGFRLLDDEGKSSKGNPPSPPCQGGTNDLHPPLTRGGTGRGWG